MCIVRNQSQIDATGNGPQYNELIANAPHGNVRLV